MQNLELTEHKGNENYILFSQITAGHDQQLASFDA